MAFSAPTHHRFWSVFGLFGAAIPLRFAVLKGRLWGLVFGASSAQPRPAQASPGQPKPWCGPCQSSAKAFSYRIQMPSPNSAQPCPAQPRPAALVWALPKHCQRLLLTGFRCGVFGPHTPSVLVRFWLVWGRRAAAFCCLEG